jgi:hypothetical protein
MWDIVYTYLKLRRPRPGAPFLDRPAKEAILQPPKPEIRLSARVLERVLDRDADMETGD